MLAVFIPLITKVIRKKNQALNILKITANSNSCLGFKSFKCSKSSITFSTFTTSRTFFHTFAAQF